MKKRTLSNIREFVQSNIKDVELISENYKNAKSPLKFKCKICNHKYSKTWNAISYYKQGCPVCSRNGEKITDSEMKIIVESHHYDLVKIVDKTTRRGTVLLVRCDMGHEHETTYRKLKAQETSRGGSCTECTKNGYSKDRKKASREMQKKAREWGYTVYDSVHIKNTVTNVIFLCKNGHKRKTTFENLRESPRCASCEGRVLKHTPKTIAKRLKEIDPNLEYVRGFNNTAEEFEYRCSCGDYTTGRLFDIEAGSRCKQCVTRRYKIEDIIPIYESFQCTLLEHAYTNTITKMNFICSCGEMCSKTFNGFRDSPMCRECSKNNRRKGKNHPSYNHNLTDEERVIRRKYPAYKEWRLSVFERDNYTCQCCGDDTGGNLVAHHILNYSEHPKLRVDVDNGITLCDIKCHKAFHDEYGYRKNNKEQLDEFIISKRKNNKEELH